MRRSAVFSLLFMLCYTQGNAMDAVVWHTIFRKAGADKTISQAYAEAYWQIGPGSIHFRKEDGMWRSKIKTDIIFSNEKGVIEEQHFVIQTAPARTQEEALAQNIMDLHRYDLPEGLIKMELRLSEPDFPNNNFSYTDTFSIEKQEGIFYSELQLLDSSYASPGKNVFEKNGQMQVPLSTNFLDDNKRVLHYYLELYNANQIPVENLPLRQHVFISRRAGEGAIQRFNKWDTITTVQQITSLQGSFAAETMQTGNYYLSISLEDKRGQILANAGLFFQRTNKKPAEIVSQTKRDSSLEKVTVVDIGKTFVAKFSLPNLLAILKMITPVADPNEQQSIRGFQKKPDDLFMRYFIYNFFASKNRQDADGEWKKYSDRVREVNRLFSGGAVPGYETDRGYVYLKYGAPDERVPVQNEQGALPYEIWEYKAIGKFGMEGVFLFYKPAEAVNDYKLLHSTVNGETRNSNWRTYLYTLTGSGSDNLNSMAEQYIRNK